MAHSFEIAFNELMGSLSLEDMEALKMRGYDIFASMRYVKHDMNLLYAAIGYWNVKTHCFAIRDCEISPLPEELGAIVGLPCSGLPCLPNISDYFYRD